MIGLTLSHYRIEAELGRGGMGVVYRAHDRQETPPVQPKSWLLNFFQLQVAHTSLLTEAGLCFSPLAPLAKIESELMRFAEELPAPDPE